jgi:hypothetical protein
MKKLITFFTRLHKKPQGSDASVASAAGPFSTKNTVLKTKGEKERKKCREEERMVKGTRRNK